MATALSRYADILRASSTVNQAWVRLHPGLGPVVTTTRTARDIDADCTRLFTDSYVTGKDMDLLNAGLHSFEVPRYKQMDISPSGSNTVTLREGKDDKLLVEVRGGDHTFTIDAADVHGKFVGNGWFGSSSWSSDENFYMYVAQTKVDKKKKTYFHQAEESIADSKFDYSEDWGEKFTDLSTLVICVLDLRKRSVRTIPLESSAHAAVSIDGGALDETWTVGQPVFIPSSAGRYSIAYTAWPIEPRRLGMIYCYQRPCSIYTTDITDLLAKADGDADADAEAEPPVPIKVRHQCLTVDMRLARSPRASADGSRLVFLGSKKGFDGHNDAVALFSISRQESGVGDAQFSTPEMVIDVVDVPKESHLGGFPGIFADQLPERCFLGKDQLLLNSMWGSTATAIYVDLEKKTISPAPHFSAALEDTKGSSTGTFSDASCQVIDVLSASDGGADADHYILYSVSAPNRPQQLALRQYREGKFSLFVAPRPKDIAITASATANKYSTSDAVPKLAPSTDEQLRGIRWKVLRFSEDGIPFDAILLTPPATPPSGVSQKKRALVVIPHGGPHSCTPTAFSPAYAYLCLQLDAAILHVNYRGSTGFGSASVRHLQGRIGQSDVADLVTATKAALADPEACIDPERVGVSGGSHGGFLSSHCIGQHPDIFKVTAMRNPVTNIPPMASVSDIPDWCYIEAMGPGNYDFSTFGLPKDPVAAFAAMRECSPVAHIDKVRAPTLLLLGAKDRRVPVSQGIEYYHLLKARGVPTKMLLFPEDDHALDKPSTEADQWVASANWLGKYLN